MTTITALLHQINELREASDASRSLVKDGLVTDMRQAARLRRTIMRTMVEIAALTERLPESDERAAFMRQFRQLRSRNADHHSSWPIAVIDLADPDYRASIDRVRYEYQRFFQFVDERYRISRSVLN